MLLFYILNLALDTVLVTELNTSRFSLGAWRPITTSLCNPIDIFPVMSNTNKQSPIRLIKEIWLSSTSGIEIKWRWYKVLSLSNSSNLLHGLLSLQKFCPLITVFKFTEDLSGKRRLPASTYTESKKNGQQNKTVQRCSHPLCGGNYCQKPLC